MSPPGRSPSRTSAIAAYRPAPACRGGRPPADRDDKGSPGDNRSLYAGRPWTTRRKGAQVWESSLRRQSRTRPAAQSVQDTGSTARTVREIYDGLWKVARAVNELRDKTGTGHGRIEQSEVSPEVARMVVQAVGLLDALMLDTLDARRASGSGPAPSGRLSRAVQAARAWAACSHGRPTLVGTGPAPGHIGSHMIPRAGHRSSGNATDQLALRAVVGSLSTWMNFARSKPGILPGWLRRRTSKTPERRCWHPLTVVREFVPHVHHLVAAS